MNLQYFSMSGINLKMLGFKDESLELESLDQVKKMCANLIRCKKGSI